MTTVTGNSGNRFTFIGAVRAGAVLVGVLAGRGANAITNPSTIERQCMKAVEDVNSVNVADPVDAGIPSHDFGIYKTSCGNSIKQYDSCTQPYNCEQYYANQEDACNNYIGFKAVYDGLNCQQLTQSQRIYLDGGYASNYSLPLKTDDTFFANDNSGNYEKITISDDLSFYNLSRTSLNQAIDFAYFLVNSSNKDLMWLACTAASDCYLANTGNQHILPYVYNSSQERIDTNYGEIGKSSAQITSTVNARRIDTPSQSPTQVPIQAPTQAPLLSPNSSPTSAPGAAPSPNGPTNTESPTSSNATLSSAASSNNDENTSNALIGGLVFLFAGLSVAGYLRYQYVSDQNKQIEENNREAEDLSNI